MVKTTNQLLSGDRRHGKVGKSMVYPVYPLVISHMTGKFPLYNIYKTKYPIYVNDLKCLFAEVFPLPCLIAKVWYICLAEGYVIMERKACEKSYWGWDVLADRLISLITWRHGVSIQSKSASNFTNQQLFHVSTHVPPKTKLSSHLRPLQWFLSCTNHFIDKGSYQAHSNPKEYYIPHVSIRFI